MRAPKLALAALGILWSVSAHAGNQTYTIHSYPSASPECHTLARDLGQRFAALYGVDVTRATCNPPSEASGVNLQIEYTADEALPFVSTRPTVSGTAEAGWFVTQADCQNALAVEIAHYTDVTGLAPFVSYCYERRFERDYSWVLRLDGFGVSPVQPGYAGTLVFGSPYDHTRSSFESTILDALIASNVDARRVTVTNVSGYATVTAIYYAPERLRLETGEFGRYDNRAQCEDQRVWLSSVYSSLEATPSLSIFCVAGFGGGSELQGIFLNDIGFDISVSVEMFPTFAACSADRTRLIEMYRHAGREIAGGICSRQTEPSAPRGWSVRLFVSN